MCTHANTSFTQLCGKCGAGPTVCRDCGTTIDHGECHCYEQDGVPESGSSKIVRKTGVFQGLREGIALAIKNMKK